MKLRTTFSLFFAAPLLVALSGRPDAQGLPSFTCGTIHSMELRLAPATSTRSHRLTVGHGAWGQCGFPAPSVQLVLVEPGTTVERGGVGSFSGCTSFSAGATVFDFTPPPGGPFEIRIKLFALGPNPWLCWSSFAVPVSGGSATSTPYGLSAGGANVLAIGGTGAAGSTLEVSVTGIPPLSAGWIVAGPTAASRPFRGGTLLVGRSGRFLVPCASDPQGIATLTAPLSPSLAGLQFHLQGAFRDAGQPLGWALSHGLRMTL